MSVGNGPVDVPSSRPERGRFGAGIRLSAIQALPSTFASFQRDALGDAAATLTYFAMLAIFPGILVVGSLVGIAGPDSAARLVDEFGPLLPGPARGILSLAVTDLQRSRALASAAGIAGLLVAVWSASGYIGAFARVCERIVGRPDRRPLWRKLVARLAMTIVLLVLLALVAVTVLLGGQIATTVAGWFGLGHTATVVWSVAKWPLQLVLLVLVVAVLFRGTPSLPSGLLTAGGVLAVLLWVVASLAFGLYVSRVANYGRTYGALAGAVVFLIWIWVSNVAVLLGAELDARGMHVDVPKD